MAAYEVAAATIRQEHQSLGLVVEVLQRMLGDIEKQHAEPDFTLFAAVLYYIEDFPERCHHPKEDEYLFDVLRRRTAEFNATLDELQADHIRSGQMVGYMERALVRFQAGVPDGLARFKETVDAYAVMLRQHMETEEAVIERARNILTADDWERIAQAFEANVDPLFGANGREEFRKLYLRIVNLLPRKVRLHSISAGAEQ